SQTRATRAPTSITGGPTGSAGSTRGPRARQAAAHAPAHATAAAWSAHGAPPASVRHGDVARDHLARAPHVLDAPIARFALDREIDAQPRIAHRREERRPVDVALPHRHLRAPFAGPLRSDGVLDV